MRISLRTGSWLLGAVVVVLGVVLWISLSRANTDPKLMVITVNRATVGSAVPDGFVGLSMEYRGLEAYAGQEPNALNPAFVQLMRNLAPGQNPVLRIGGDGTDWTWYRVKGVRQPPGVKYSLDKDWLQVARAVTRAIHGRLILGINLEADNRRVATGEAQAFVGGIGKSAIDALELGNEPELYGSFGWYKNAAGVPVTGRPRGYSFSDYLHDFSSFASVLPQVPVAGPSTGSLKYMAQLGTFLAAERRVRLVTLHGYPLKHCSKSSHPTSAQLLSDTATAGFADGFAPYVAVARRHGVSLRVDEMNGITCGGERGVSDTFASALWALSTLFQMARIGVVGVNIHTVPNTINEVIGSNQVKGTWQAAVHPEYYGMMMFAQAAPAGSRLLQVGGGDQAGVTTFATRAPDGHVRVVLINRASGSRTVKVKIPAVHGSGLLERLLAPSVGATSGVTLGGQSFGGVTKTGTLGGPQQVTGVEPSGGGYVVTLPATSATLLVF